nr:DUF1778 domain-containing protein [Caulobacter sp. BP25]
MGAADAFLDQRVFRLASEHFDAFAQALDSPPEPGPKLKRLLTRTPPWKR